MVRGVFRVAALAAALLAAAPAVAQPETVPPETVPTAADLGALPIVSNPKLSPDGKRVITRGLIDGKQMGILVDMAAPSGKQLQPIPIPDKHQLEWVRWAGNDRVLVSVSRKDTLMGDDVRVTRIFMIDLITGRNMLIGPREQGVDGDDLVYVDPAGKFLLLSTQPSIYEYPSVFRVDLATGKSSKIVPSQTGVWEWFADPDGVVRGGVGIDGAIRWLLYRSHDGEPFKRIQRHNANNEADKDNGIQSFAPVVGSDQGYAIADGKRGHFALYRYDFKADALGELLYENPSVDIDDYTIGRDGALLGVEYIDDRPEIAWFDAEMKTQQARIDRALPGAINRVVSVSEDRNTLLVWTRKADDPGAYYVYEKPNKRMYLLAEPYEALRGKQLAKMEPVRYKARDGLEIRAYLTLPPGKESAQGLPLVVMPHGGPFVRDEWSYDPWVQYLAARGYAVLQPNFRGSTGFGRAFVEKGNGQWGRGMQDDVDDGVAWLAGRGMVDAKRVCIMGASFGGYAAMWAAVRNPEIYRCAISFAGISDVESMLRYDRKSFAATRYFRDWRERVQGEKGFSLGQISPITLVDRMKVPILIAHGSEDDNVPLYQSRRLHDALLKLKREHVYVVYPGEGHGFADPKNSTDFLNRVGAFLDKYNPAK